MKTNMGKTDKIIRVILALIFGGLYVTHTVTGTWGIVLLILAIVFLLTSLVGHCPLYTLFGVNSCPKPKKPE